VRKRIVYNRKDDGGVNICQPSPRALRCLQMGGRWQAASRGFVDRQIASQIARGISPDAAARYAMAMLFGGVTEGEAWAIIRDRDCAPHGSMFELMDLDELPQDRWFRDAWHRSANGGPIGIHLPKARRLQLDKIKTAVTGHNKRRLALGRAPLVPLWGELGNAIKHARDEDELRRVWPAGLPARVTGNVSRETKERAVNKATGLLQK
jgi:hypothetical protein